MATGKCVIPEGESDNSGVKLTSDCNYFGDTVQADFISVNETSPNRQMHSSTWRLLVSSSQYGHCDLCRMCRESPVAPASFILTILVYKFCRKVIT